VDLLRYLVADPVALGAAGPAKYRATLTAVQAGAALRPVTPPVEVFFITPDPLVAATVERRA
jgi:hypothetical protein